jgi:hypothetical protein
MVDPSVSQFYTERKYLSAFAIWHHLLHTQGITMRSATFTCIQKFDPEGMEENSALADTKQRYPQVAESI